jgi:hypothetical protein
MTDDDHGHDHDDEGIERVTSPMQEYSMREVGFGLVVFAIGLLVTFVVPLLG